MEKAYITGPIDTDVPGTDIEERKARFHRCEEWVGRHMTGLQPINPLKVEACSLPNLLCEKSQRYPKTHDWECWLRYDLKALLECNVIIMLPHCNLSRGAKLEIFVAQELGLRPHIANELGEVIL